ncbi:MAG TPA: hypothetical protein VFO16_00120 [Pseudonocardiaceae bacterium]|nr:hypothetical protein [Pseudonocardiaceae bacterium]
MSLYVVVHPRFGDTARVAADERHRPRLVADIGAGGAVSIQVDDEPGSTELAAGFARSLAAAALRFAQLCEESIPGPMVARPVMCGEVSTVGDL